ncbi:MAG TPA: 50S ribosomal protein L23 [Candidatus Babeliales bacterium]|nr:50S ribosomal protein L23 [Candidatus Babeliales bacterium]
MELSIYNVILGPVVSSKASGLMQQFKQVVLRIHPQANKPMVKEALKKLFNVETETVRIVVRKGKNRTVKRKITQGKLSKRAIVTLKPGYSLGVAETGQMAAAEQLPAGQK